jgi:hypothetical protein
MKPKRKAVSSAQAGKRSYSTERDRAYAEGREAHLAALSGKLPASALVDNFAKYARRQEITRFLARHELFKMVAGIQGCILECGVYAGQGLMSWAQISSILEPVGGAFRHVYGFDTFDGFPSVHGKDLRSGQKLDWRQGDLRMSSYEDLQKCIELYDLNRFLPQFPKVSLVKGDFRRTARAFLKDNPHVLVSLLYLDFDLYEPTKTALELFLPRMSAGAVIAFDEINHPLWPGETLALLEAMDLRRYEVCKFPFEINMSYIVL